MITLRQVKSTFLSELKAAYSFIKLLNEATHNNQISLNSKELGYIYEIAFIKIFTGWEKFLEKSFVYYLSGKSTVLFKPQTITRKLQAEKAYNLVKGTKKYPDWTNVDDIIKLSNLFFKDGKPYSNIIPTIRQELNSMKTVRNAITHISKNSKINFKELLRKEIPNYNIEITPGEFLSHVDSTNNKEKIVSFSETLVFAANVIIKTK